MRILFALFLFFLILLEGVYISQFVITKKTKINFELINLTTSCTAHVKSSQFFLARGRSLQTIRRYRKLKKNEFLV